MKNLFYILSIIVTIIGAWFAYDNKNKLVEQKALTADATEKKNRITAKIAKEQDVRDELIAEIDATKAEVANVEAQLEAAKSKEGRHNNTLASLDSEVSELESDLASYQGLIEKVEEALRDQNLSNIEDVPVKIEQLRQDARSKEDALISVELINESLAKKVARQSSDKESVAGRLAKIKQNIRRNNMEARITSVNSSWGFVVINAGSDNSNINSSTELIVKRGSQRLGTLKAATVSPNQTICDIDSDLGYSIRPGDRVILKETVGK